MRAPIDDVNNNKVIPRGRCGRPRMAERHEKSQTGPLACHRHRRRRLRDQKMNDINVHFINGQQRCSSQHILPHIRNMPRMRHQHAHISCDRGQLLLCWPSIKTNKSTHQSDFPTRLVAGVVVATLSPSRRCTRLLFLGMLMMRCCRLDVRKSGGAHDIIPYSRLACVRAYVRQ